MNMRGTGRGGDGDTMIGVPPQTIPRTLNRARGRILILNNGFVEMPTIGRFGLGGVNTRTETPGEAACIA